MCDGAVDMAVCCYAVHACSSCIMDVDMMRQMNGLAAAARKLLTTRTQLSEQHDAMSTAVYSK